LFDNIQRFDTTPGQDDVAYQAMLEAAARGFDWATNNCWYVIEEGLEAAMVTHEEAWFPNQAFVYNWLSQFATELNFNDVKNGLAE
jgi:hypothetical protein